MTTNEVLTKYNFLSKIVLKDGDNELSKDLKIKIVKSRIEYAKVRKTFDEDLQEFVKTLAPQRFVELQQKAEKTEEETKELSELTDKINSDYNSYIIERGKDEVACNDIVLTEDEYNEIIETNVNNDVNINGQSLSSAEFLEIFYALFVK